MTKLISILFLVLYLSPLKQDEPASRIASFKLPNNLEERNAAQITAFIKENYKYLIHFGNPKNTYMYGNIILGFEDYDAKNVDFIDLQQKKQSWLGLVKELNREKRIVRSDIISINKTSFLILGQFSQDEYAYNVLSETKGKTGLGIQLLFKAADKAKAEKLLMEFLSGITFRPASIVNN